MENSQWLILNVIAEVIYMISQGISKKNAITIVSKKYNIKESEIEDCF